MFRFGIVALNTRLGLELLAHFIDLIVVHDMTFLDESIRILELSLRLGVTLLRVCPICLNGLIENDGLDLIRSLLFFPLCLHHIPHRTANPLLLCLQLIAVCFLEMVLELMLSSELIDDLLVLKPLRFLNPLWRGVVIGEVIEPSGLLRHDYSGWKIDFNINRLLFITLSGHA